MLVPGLVALLGSTAVGLGIQMSQPRVHDEFSYLLAADTFLEGRLTNPTHPMWEHFETFHVIHQPTYASKYPPAQGLVLAAGTWLAGHPLVGVWLSVALMCSLFAWMLLACLPPRWALLGGLLAALRFGIAGYWSQSYWGGAVAALSGALVFGAVVRMLSGPRLPHAILLGLGVAGLLNSRPYEGALVSLCAGVALAWHGLRRRDPVSLRVFAVRVVAPLAVMMMLTASWMAYYNWRVTGAPLRFPYSVHEATYASVPVFVFQDPKPDLSYRHETIRRFWTEWASSFYYRRSDLSGFLETLPRHFELAWRFQVGWLWTLPLALGVCLPGRPWRRFFLATGAIVLLAETLIVGVNPHYLAPITGALIALIVAGLQAVDAWRPARARVGRGLVVVLVALTALETARRIETHRVDDVEWTQARARILERLSRQGGQHLVVVRYGSRHSYIHEWVYNEADIDGAEVVWAREMGPERDRALLDSFRDRTAWLLEVDEPRMTFGEHPLTAPREP